MANVITILPATLVVPANAGGVSAAFDVRSCAGPLTFNINGNDGDVIRVQGSPDGVNLWADLVVLGNNAAVQTPTNAVVGFIRLVRDKVDPTPGVVPVVPSVSMTAQPLPSGYSFSTAAVAVPAGDGVGASVNLQSAGLTNEVTSGGSKSIVCSAFDAGDRLTLEASADGNAPWSTVMQLQPGKLLQVSTSVGFVRIRRARVAAAGPRVGVDGATAAFMGQGITATSSGGIDVASFGAIGDGVHDDTAAWQAAAAAANVNGGTVLANAKQYLLTDTILFNNNAGRIVFGGTDLTRIIFNPAVDKTCFKWSAGAGQQAYGAIIGPVLMTSTDVAHAKTALEMIDHDGFVLKDFYIDPSWAGGAGFGSIGLRFRGTQAMSVENYRAFCDQPIVFSPNPHTAIVGDDHCHFFNTYLRPTPGGGRSCVEVEDGTIISNLTFDGFNAWIVDKWGLHWVETTSPAVHQSVRLVGVRCEQAVDATGYSFFVDTTQTLQVLEFVDCQVASAQNGFWIKGAQNCTIKSTISGINNAGRFHLVVDRMKDLFIENCLWQINTGATLTGLQLQEALPQVSAAVLPSTGYYSDTTTSANVDRKISNVIGIRAQKIKSTDVANGLAVAVDTVNAFTGGNPIFNVNTAGTNVAYVGSNGSVLSGLALFDKITSGTCNVATNFATLLLLGSVNCITATTGGRRKKRTAVADAAYTALLSDHIIGYTSLTAGRTVTIPAGAATGNEYIIKNESAGAFAITIQPVSGTIDGVASVATTAAGRAAAIRVYSDGSNWFTA